MAPLLAINVEKIFHLAQVRSVVIQNVADTIDIIACSLLETAAFCQVPNVAEHGAMHALEDFSILVIAGCAYSSDHITWV